MRVGRGCGVENGKKAPAGRGNEPAGARAASTSLRGGTWMPSSIFWGIPYPSLSEANIGSPAGKANPALGGRGPA